MQELPSELRTLAQHHLDSLLEDSDLILTDKCRHHLLRAFALSDFVAQSCLQDPDIIVALITDSVPYPNHAYNLQKLIPHELPEEQVKQVLRHYRRTWMTVIAARDVTNTQSIDTSLQQVSMLADALIMAAYHWAYQHYCTRYGTPQGKHGPMPMLIVGMGKLGGRELNFSSDIDLIFFYPKRGEIEGGRKSVEHQVFFTRVAQKLISLLDQVTADGQVFRVDMRLRPFGESGPLVMHFAAMEDYYQEQGRDWERYAMIKGRVLNPDCPYYDAIKDILAPFVYRRYLDYGAIDALRKMKQLINQEVRRRRLSDNVKLGRGGIREAEFIVQSFQLIRGGRDHSLRHPSILKMLKQLTESELLEPHEADTLQDAYLYLRKVEHCLQQFQDKQTQELPDDDINWQRLITVMECDNQTQFRSQLQKQMDTIHALFSEIIGEDDDNESPDTDEFDAAQDLWQLSLSEDETASLLETWINQQDATLIHLHLCDFKQHISKHRTGQRGLNLLGELMPLLLESILLHYADDAAMLTQRIVDVLDAIIGRTAYLELLTENRRAAEQLLKLCEASPWITEQIKRFPILLDELLNPAQLYTPTPPEQFHNELRQFLLRLEPDDLEQQMEMMRQFKLGQQLKVAASDVTGALSVMKISDHLTFLAEALLQQVFVYAWQQVSEKHGCPPGTSIDDSHFAIIGYGKLGGLELGYGSDLDLVFVHDYDGQGETDGPRPVDANRFYMKLAQRIMHLLNTKTVYGELYETDLRLRPSGNAGLLVCHINAFEHYQLNEAWTWEHQALVRARCVLGSVSLAGQVENVRSRILCLPRDESELRQQVSEMREKMRTHLDKSNEQDIDLKHAKGGIVDIEFLVQYWALHYAHDCPDIIKWSDNVRLLERLEHHNMLSSRNCQQLTKAYLTLRNESHRLALQQRSKTQQSEEISQALLRVSEIWDATFN
ncbi:bifunctional [glutamate--ammonia ligase]-adenylyl-L-tyrosine phosphorylase/[glutamate--ammonia-ligase] adenylyltransferase [Aestuariibacter salexigens]|uniref:bifunctional [glutamate--ammonia ligase]-adenylyl-L-tyrosine phosphorylase/[glutamate--ammonia-ligase] adenylyltransferase n=1 Tax=Aestuariibacter salexigens TaxID=226010 RepID=UPI00040C5A89|nr:bifunctional [glutamate--ammonia ligase]-adenylyl-L-tyrosine phosphorylase/[glutamate--ammonia-ligase] adenylyltransferase [Aestuariibacter salexigens]